MSVSHPFTSDRAVADLLEGFESCTWPFDQWTHEAHLAVATACVREMPFNAAVERVRRGIQRYNASAGRTSGYHETITLFFLHRVRDTVTTLPPGSTLADAVDVVIRACPMTILRTAYSTGVIESDAARTGWVEPDLAPLSTWAASTAHTRRSDG